MSPLPFAAALLAGLLVPAAVTAHSPSVTRSQGSTPAEAVVLEDATLSRALGATIGEPGEVDWYRLDLEAGEPLLVGMTAPDAEGAVAATFTLVGPGLPPAIDAGPQAQAFADAAGVDGAVVFEPASDPPLEVHAGLGFTNFGNLSLAAPASGSYWVAVYATDPEATGKYVFAPGVREEFGADAIGGMADLIAFFMAPWPPEGTPAT
jgi:nitroreductase